MSKTTKKLFSVFLILSLLFSTACSSGTNSVEVPSNTYTVAEIQKYGNLILSVSGTDFLKNYTYGDIISAEINGSIYDMPVGSSYSDVDDGEKICRITIDEEENANHVILAINMGDLATETGVASKTETEEEPGFRWDYNEGIETPVEVTISMKIQGGYYDEYVMRQLERSNERDDYTHLDDAAFANFRPITTTGMGEGKLYRSSSPVNPEIGRNNYADAAVEASGIRTIINLADTEDGMKAYEGFDDTYYSGCNSIGLNLGVDFNAEDFQTGLAEGMRFLAAEKDGPYLIHCNEGKDRAGFVSALLECLMGASAEEVVDDYMTTYYNYYGVETESIQYIIIAESNIEKSLASAFDIEDIRGDGVDLAAEAECYMTEKLGLTAEEIASIKANLT